MAVLYVVEQGAQLACEGGRVVVRRRGRTVRSLPLHQVEQVVVLGRVQPTVAALDLLLARGAPLHYLNSRGVLKGVFWPPLGKHVLLRRRQFQRADDPAFCTQVARAVVSAKLGNQRQACLRWGRNHALAAGDEAAAALAAALRQVPAAAPPELLGLEGAATRAYYAAMRALVEDKLPFGRRSRRPATDPVSALLNLAAGLLRSQVLASLTLVGLDPYQGYYHTYKYGRPALALDLMEEFRPLLADGVAVAAINREVIQADDFQDTDGLCLCESALERFVALFDRRLRDEVVHPVTGRRHSYRACLELQARMLARAVLGELPGYLGFAPEH